MSNASTSNDWTKPAAMAIPKEGYFTLEQGRYGATYPRTPACHGFTIIAKIKPGTEGEIRAYGKKIEDTIAASPNALMPYMIAANAVPIVAFAPITNAWFGTLSPWSKVVIAAVLCFFPVLVNTLRGLTSVRPESLELMRSYAAPQRVVFARVRIPNSLPFVFSALKIASVLAMIGAVVGDYFGGSTEALGVQIVSSVSLAQYETAWAAILVASFIGIGFYAVVALAERLVLGWHPSIRAGVE